MVVGDGMMALAFSALRDEPGIVVFASGVSNSLEETPAAFHREKALLRRVRAFHPDALLLYFGTCSVYDPESRDTPYVRHKLDMEAEVAAGPGPWLILRLPLALGRGHRGRTLAKVFHERILRGDAFEVWRDAVRYPIDVEDVFRIASRLVGDRNTWNRTINVALRAYSPLDFVKIIEAIAGRPAKYTLVPKGRAYPIDCPEVQKLADELDLDYGAGYLERVLRKYYSGAAQPDRPGALPREMP